MKLSLISSVLSVLALSWCPADAWASRVAYFPMETDGETITEEVSGLKYTVEDAHSPLCIPASMGKGLRFDGYSTYVVAELPSGACSDLTAMTVSLWCAVETYPVMAIDAESSERALIAGNIDETARTGFAFYLGRDGSYSFECYSGGWKVSCEAPSKLPCYEWNHLVVTADCANKTVSFYNNGVLVASSKCMDNINIGSHSMMIGCGDTAIFYDSFMLNTFNGIIDEIELYDEVVNDESFLNSTAENDVDLNYPMSRYADDIMRPQFHGMPTAAWTNECHGLVEYDGQYHLFFQKNANGPYMTRLQWGHLVSDNLITWTEEPIALFADQSYDIKGCWSGCTFVDDILTGGKPNIFYTAVDYAKATIAQAVPDNDDLLNWTKPSANPVINGCPSGLSDDFRDPKIFKTDNGDYYMIVGTSKNNLGATTLHKYDTTTGTWSNDGSIFFNATSLISGKFWEMPTIDEIDGKWLFTTTPLETTQGVETQYWVGDINADGTFSPSSTNPGKVELEGMSHDGYGLLSPAIALCDGKTIAMGIVPDKLSEDYNYQLGYAHTYSLPREWSIDTDNQLVQKPFDGLSTLRTDIQYSETNSTLNGSRELGDVSGRMVEIIGEFTITSTTEKVGFRLLDDDNNALLLYYYLPENKIVVDMTSVARWVNDAGVYDGLYESALPKTLSVGSTIKIHAFFDHSILDVFINDTWAFSVRVFATDANAVGVKAFAEGSTDVESICAWNLDPEQINGTSIENPFINEPEISFHNGNIVFNNVTEGSLINIYNVQGMCLQSFKYDGYTSIPIQGKGMFIIKVSKDGNTAIRKLMLR